MAWLSVPSGGGGGGVVVINIFLSFIIRRLQHRHSNLPPPAFGSRLCHYLTLPFLWLLAGGRHQALVAVLPGQQHQERR